jgi:hypothetical protein
MENWRSWSRRTRKRWLATTVVSWIWCLIPLVTFGFGTVPVMLYAAVRKRSLLQGLSVVVYAIAAGAAFATASGDTPVEEELSGFAIVINMFVGFGHALAIRRWTFDIHSIGAVSRLIDRQREAVDMHS